MKKATFTLGVFLVSTVLASQALAQDPPTSPSTPPAAPQEPAATPTAPAQPEPPAAAPTTPTTTADTPTPAAPPPEKKKAPRPFAGSALFTQVSMFTGTVFQGQQQSTNPTGEVSFFFLPRYAINKDFQLRGRIPFNYEFTNSDSTKTRYEPRFGDAVTQLFYRGIPAVAGIKPLAGVSLAFPVSPESRARTMWVTPGVVVQLARGFEHLPGGGELLLLAGSTFTHPLYSYTTPETRNDHPYAFSCYGGGQGCAGQLSGLTNAANTLGWTFLASAEWGKWNPAIFALGSHQWAYRPKDVPGLPTPNEPRLRQSVYFAAWLDYNVNSWLTPEVGYFMFRNIVRDDGTYGNPFFDRFQDTRVYIGANVNLDTFVQKYIQREADGEAGVVRARNKSPVMAF